MKLVVGSTQLSKVGFSADATDDALGVSPRPTGKQLRCSAAAPVRVMVADGATESYLAGHWARHLVQTGLGAVPEILDLAGVITTARETWTGELAAYESGRNDGGRPMQWYEERKAEQGSAATLAMVDIKPSRIRTFPALRRRPVGDARIEVVGDCLAVLVRENSPVAICPTDDVGAFGNMPDLVSSTGSSATTAVSESMDLYRGDLLLLMTDAVAVWVLDSLGRSPSPWRQLAELAGGDESAVQAGLAQARDAGDIRNDDLSVVAIAVR